ncbi:hypothetical protein BTO06_09225 [Tenacibaculum sp. SZ-18]|uniref:TonB family protein n=1 Tax=Tenacibaculum sp. SZ-18 TaxID=754423 RepID=UPI000C2D5D09|nr:TonB family protein [Tenacibaculum sp. SZ-18]AUC15310.1 hypothetical protein BTO06_09225 [Tenacibaculum sp. SZ-18]
MKKQILFILFLFSITVFFGQETKNYIVGDTIYYKSQKISLLKSDRYAVIREIKPKSILVDLYFRHNDTIIKDKTTHIKNLKKLESNGKTITYYRSGEIHSKGNYVKGYRVGLWDFYLKNELLNYTEFYKREKKNYISSKIIDAWDLKGNQTVKNGSGTLFLYHPKNTDIIEFGELKNSKKVGTWQKKDSERLIFEENYENDKLTKGKSWDKQGKKYKYKKIFERAKYLGGPKQINRFIANNFNVPDTLIKSNFHGRVYALFKISKAGKVTNIRVKKSTHPDLEKEIKRVLQKMKAWKPGKERGQLAATNFTIPFVL